MFDGVLRHFQQYFSHIVVVIVFEELPATIGGLKLTNIHFTLSSLPVKLHLPPSNPQLTQANLHVKYCYKKNLVKI